MLNKPYDGRVLGSALQIPIADESVQSVITSPPYWGLRRYEIPDSIFGGDPNCKHRWGAYLDDSSVRERRIYGKSRTTNRFYGHPSRRFMGNHEKHFAGAFCKKCDAWKGQLGCEPDPELYIDHLLGIFKEVWRVLRKDGSVWLNLGDCFTDSGRGSDTGSTLQGTRHNQKESRRVRVRENTRTGLRPKNLVLMPWRVLIALQDAGWYVRSIIVWHKVNPMPGSQQDRPTSSWEPLFLLSKSKRYYYDRIAIMEPCTGNAHSRGNGTGPKTDAGLQGVHRNNASFSSVVTDVVLARNKRDVWSIATEQLDADHYAAFPQALVEPCLLASTSEHGACAQRGSPYKRIVEKQMTGNMCGDEKLKEEGVRRTSAESKAKWRRAEKNAASARMIGSVKIARANGNTHDQPFVPPLTVGWKKTCRCETDERVPCRVMDPFAGSGTVSRVSERHNRWWVALDLGYQDMQKRLMRGIQKRLTGLLA